MLQCAVLYTYMLFSIHNTDTALLKNTPAATMMFSALAI